MTQLKKEITEEHDDFLNIIKENEILLQDVLKNTEKGILIYLLILLTNNRQSQVETIQLSEDD